MPFTIRCAGCGQNLAVPDELTGKSITCPNCKTAFEALPLLMPPPVPGVATPIKTTPAVATPAPTPPSKPSGHQAAASGLPTPNQPPPGLPTHNPPAGLSGTPSVSQPFTPSAHVPTMSRPPITRPPAPSVASAVAAPGAEIQTYEAVDRAVKMRRSTIWVWLLSGMCVVGLSVIVIYMLVEGARINPPLSDIKPRFKPEQKALDQLGPRQTGARYSFKMPDFFVTAASPSTDRLPAGTQSYAWEAIKDSEEKGSELRIWVIPAEMDIYRELEQLRNVGGRLDYRAAVTQISSHRRMGRNMLAVAGRLDGSTDKVTRVGVIYIAYDRSRRNTLLIIGMGVGPKAKSVQYLLDNAVRTIEFKG